MVATTRQPIRWVRDNIVVTREGQPYAVWALQGMAYGLATHQEKERVRATHQDLFQSLTGEYTLLGLVATTPPETIVELMLEGIPNPSEEWLEECERTFEDLQDLPAGERAYFLVAPLGASGVGEFFGKVREQAGVMVAEALGLPLTPPDERNFETWKAKAKSIEGRIPAAFQPQRAGISALRWITHHLTTRGQEASSAYAFRPVEETGRWINAASCLPEPLLDEAGLTDVPEGKAARTNLFQIDKRFVKVEAAGSEPSYQTFSTVGLTPQQGFVFPGSEFISFAASLPQDVDFCVRITATPAARAKAKNRSAERNLEDQYTHRMGDQGITGGNSELDRSAQQLKEYVAALNVTDREVEIAATIIFSTAGTDPDWSASEMKAVRDLYTSEEWTLDVPLGGQEQLFWDFWPASTPSRTTAEYVQITTGYNFSMGIPLAVDTLGSRSGFRIAVNITTGRHSPVLMEIGGLTENDISGSFGISGELGSGKSVLLKLVGSHSIDRGALLVVVDHSDNQEWAALARDLTTANVIDFMDPTQSLDPLRLWDTDQKKQRQTLTLLSMMLGISATDQRYGLINAELKRLLQDKSVEPSMTAFKDHLTSSDMAEDDKQLARDIARQLDIYADLDFARTFFDPSLPLLDFSAQATVFCTHGMDLPTKEELHSEHSRREMSLGKMMGRAAYAYLAQVGTSVMYDDDGQEVLFLVDEAHHMTGSPEGEAAIMTAVKTSRKHLGAVGLASHTAEELGSEELRGLIPQRFVFRTRDRGLAKKNLAWLDPTYATDEYVEMISRQTAPMGSDNKVPDERRGEALYRDHLNRVGKIKVLLPLSPSRRKAVLTTPPKRSERMEGALA
mgnify:CR=1 FL=1